MAMQDTACTWIQFVYSGSYFPLYRHCWVNTSPPSEEGVDAGHSEDFWDENEMLLRRDVSEVLFGKNGASGCEDVVHLSSLYSYHSHWNTWQESLPAAGAIGKCCISNPSNALITPSYIILWSWNVPVKIAPSLIRKRTFRSSRANGFSPCRFRLEICNSLFVPVHLLAFSFFASAFSCLLNAFSKCSQSFPELITSSGFSKSPISQATVSQMKSFKERVNAHSRTALPSLSRNFWLSC